MSKKPKIKKHYGHCCFHGEYKLTRRSRLCPKCLRVLALSTLEREAVARKGKKECWNNV